MVDPVTCADGHSFERAYIEGHLRMNNTNPVTNTQLADQRLTTNFALRSSIEEWKAERFRLVTRHQIDIGREIGEGSFKVALNVILALFLHA